MPPLPPAPQTLLARIEGSNQGQTFNNIFHLQYTGTVPDAAALTSLAVEFGNAWSTSFQAVLNGDVQRTLVQLVDLSSQTGAQGELSGGAFGGRTGDALPCQVCCVISWHVNLRYRGGHPRTYLPAGVLTDVLTGRTWTGTFLGEVDAAAENFLTQCNALVTGATSYKLAVVSYHTANTLRPTPLTLPINGHAVHSRVDTQRRRLGKEA